MEPMCGASMPNAAIHDDHLLHFHSGLMRCCVRPGGPGCACISSPIIQQITIICTVPRRRSTSPGSGSTNYNLYFTDTGLKQRVETPRLRQAAVNTQIGMVCNSQWFVQISSNCCSKMNLSPDRIWFCPPFPKILSPGRCWEP